MQSYCAKCKAQVQVNDPKAIAMKNSQEATQGTCKTCETKVFKIENAA